MPGRLQRAGNIIPGPRTPATGLGPLSAGQTFTTPRYPGAIDDVGTGKGLEFADDATVLVSLFTNFLGAIIEAIQAEVGPLATAGEDVNTWIAGSKNLRDLLDKISLASNIGKGQLVGIKRWRRVSTVWGGQQLITVDAGFKPAGAPNPAVWCYVNRAGSQKTLPQLLLGLTIVRGFAVWVSGTDVSVQLSGARIGPGNPGIGGAPGGADIFVVEGLLFFMPIGDPNA